MQTFQELEARAHEDCEHAPDVTVRDYFMAALGFDPIRPPTFAASETDEDVSVGEEGLGMSLQTPCGVMCKHAIDRAAAFLPFAENSGDDVDFVSIVRSAVLVLIFG